MHLLSLLGRCPRDRGRRGQDSSLGARHSDGAHLVGHRSLSAIGAAQEGLQPHQVGELQGGKLERSAAHLLQKLGERHLSDVDDLGGVGGRIGGFVRSEREEATGG
jgi:hypothetical protein